MADTPITREELYLSFLTGETDVIPEPVTRVEKYLYQLCQKAVLAETEVNDITLSVVTKNTTLGVDYSQSMNIKARHIKLGKIHFIAIEGGAKIYSTSTATYQTTITIEIPGSFFMGLNQGTTQGGGISTINEPNFSTFTEKMVLTLIYTQPNSTSQYSPDSVYRFKSLTMLVEN